MKQAGLVLSLLYRVWQKPASNKAKPPPSFHLLGLAVNPSKTPIAELMLYRVWQKPASKNKSAKSSPSFLSLCTAVNPGRTPIAES